MSDREGAAGRATKTMRICWKLRTQVFVYLALSWKAEFQKEGKPRQRIGNELRLSRINSAKLAVLGVFCLWGLPLSTSSQNTLAMVKPGLKLVDPGL